MWAPSCINSLSKLVDLQVAQVVFFEEMQLIQFIKAFWPGRKNGRTYWLHNTAFFSAIVILSSLKSGKICDKCKSVMVSTNWHFIIEQYTHWTTSSSWHANIYNMLAASVPALNMKAVQISKIMHIRIHARHAVVFLCKDSFPSVYIPWKF